MVHSLSYKSQYNRSNEHIARARDHVTKTTPQNTQMYTHTHMHARTHTHTR
jgi:hypothetical protein